MEQEQIRFLLLTQVWQIAVLFVLVSVSTRLIRNTRPHLALVLWILFFMKCLIPPIIMSPIGVFAWQTPIPTVAGLEESSIADEFGSLASAESSTATFFKQARGSRFSPLEIFLKPRAADLVDRFLRLSRCINRLFFENQVQAILVSDGNAALALRSRRAS